MKKENMTVLYVDDQVENLTPFKILFEDDFNVLTALSGKEALDLLKKHGEVPIIITDQRMPGMNGVELLEIVLDLYPDTVRILMTAYTEREDLLDAINTGKVYSYIVKPWEINEVRKSLIESFERYFLIKENKRLVRELQKKIAELNKAQEKLIFQEKRAIIGTLTTGLYHEINNFLSPIAGLELIINEVSEKHKKILTNVIDGRDKIIDIISEIKALAKNEPAAYSFKCEKLSKVIDEALHFAKLNPKMRLLNISTEISFNDKILMNKNRIIQVLLNLIQNAASVIRDMPDGKIVVNIEKSEDFAVVNVINNGETIKPENIPLIWKPFYTTKGDEGTGLGLDISRRIIEGHKGKIKCYTNENNETVFSFSLPLKMNVNGNSK